MIREFPAKCLGGLKVKSPWNENLFTVREYSKRHCPANEVNYSTQSRHKVCFCANGPDQIHPLQLPISTRVTCSADSDWEKLTRMVKYLRQTADDRLTLRADGSHALRWHVDASFGVHPDYRSHTGATMSMGQGAVISISRKQGLNTRSSTEAELVAADEVAGGRNHFYRRRVIVFQRTC
jgi:hypothetical protein